MVKAGWGRVVHGAANAGLTGYAYTAAYCASKHALVGLTRALAAGIAFHAIETAVGIMFGLASLVWLAPYPPPAARRRAPLAGTGTSARGTPATFRTPVPAPHLHPPLCPCPHPPPLP